MIIIETKNYLYTYSWEPNEASLCALERRILFGEDSESSILESSIEIDPSRSPFIRERLEIICEAGEFVELLNHIHQLEAVDGFKVVFVQNPDAEKVGFKKLRKIEKEVGLHLKGEAELVEPHIWYGIIQAHDRWVFGKYVRNEAVWLHHVKKPHSYSTALSTRVARAVVNIAAPETSGVKMIDPCCGIGTVLVEALSMGIDIVGSDRNPLILDGVRENIAHFGLEGDVSLRDINDITGSYDVAVIDLPYNLCSVISDDEQLEMLRSARRFADKVVIVTLEDVDANVTKAGFDIIDRCEVSKGRFVRQILVCA
ncbi:TRM11 family SAM-dependent methyltransferase [Rossellomorea sp. YZS02]|uniref:TRM11 family SAM-dependent methyltransferase n=1 Tax=Rossellomorea sp. YZS02 TaxID=3097358 RepID=UPI002A0D6848|nr:RsmD family RNA methyltransferase [Rossellomorea sp. YZS02]MDX8342321.1 RsmD family RNA methyltransferase [Rossellomorea sp. YZS02]